MERNGSAKCFAIHYFYYPYILLTFHFPDLISVNRDMHAHLNNQVSLKISCKQRLLKGKHSKRYIHISMLHLPLKTLINQIG